MSRPVVEVGCYLEVKENVTLTTKDWCKSHEREDHHIFCPTCGRRDRYYTSKSSPIYDDFLNHQDWVDRLVEVYSLCDQYFLISNLYSCTRLDFSLSDFEILEIPKQEDCREEFLSYHQKDIDRLKELGCSVELKFGIVGWVPD